MVLLTAVILLLPIYTLNFYLVVNIANNQQTPTTNNNMSLWISECWSRIKEVASTYYDNDDDNIEWDEIITEDFIFMTKKIYIPQTQETKSILQDIFDFKKTWNSSSFPDFETALSKFVAKFKIKSLFQLAAEKVGKRITISQDKYGCGRILDDGSQCAVYCTLKCHVNSLDITTCCKTAILKTKYINYHSYSCSCTWCV